MLLFNRLGLILFLVAFGAGWGIARVAHWSGEGMLMLIAGPLLCGLDAGYRRIKGLPFFRRADEGGTVLFLPAWFWGVFWTGLGAFYHFR
jgi:hypothetical protein